MSHCVYALRSTALAVLCLAALSLQVHAAQAPAPDAYLAVQQIEALSFSPDGKLLAWQTTRPVGPKGTEHRIWIAQPESGRVEQVSREGSQAWSPRWRPTGDAISFLSDSGGDDGVVQVHVQQIGAAASRPVTRSVASVTAYDWAPDAKSLIYIAEASQGTGASAEDWRVVDRDEPLPALWLADLVSGENRRVTTAAWRVREAIWSADGSGVFFIGSRSPKNERYVDELFFVPADSMDQSSIRSLQPISGRAAGLQGSPDGRQISYIGGRNGGSPHDLFVYSRDGDVLRNVTAESIDQAITRTVHGGVGYVWKHDKQLLVTHAQGFRTAAALVGVDGASDAYELPLSNATSIAISPRGQWTAVAASSLTTLPEVHVRQGGKAWRKLSAVNGAINARAILPLEIFSYRSFDGTQIEGALLAPPRDASSGPPPLVVHAHGGPADRWTDDLDSWGQYYAANGYAVFYPNVRGSTGYGYEFMSSVRRDWGGGDFKDLMAGVDALIGLGRVDGERIAISGWSYGGYMAAWAVTQTTRFRAAVAGAGLYDLASEFGTESTPAYDEWYLGTPYEDWDVYSHSSPLRHIRNVRTPTLILHGASDDIDPLSQAQQLYRAFKWLDVPSEMVVYRRAGHLLTKQAQVIDTYRRSVDWLDRYVKAAASQRPRGQ